MSDCTIPLRTAEPGFDNSPWEHPTATIRLLLLRSPQNPSGIAIAQDDLGRILERVRERSPKTYLIIDEVYRAIIFRDGLSPKSLPSAESPRVL